MTDRVTTQQIAAYLRRLGVKIDTDFERQRLYIVSIEAPMEVVLPKREGDLYFHPGDLLQVDGR